MNDAIAVSGLLKSYGSHTVLKGLHLQVRQGEVFALLGVNGAGKTTALECMEGLRRYDSGHIQVDGKMGIQLQSGSLPSHIRAMEAVHLFAKWNHAVIDRHMLDALSIHELGKKHYTDLSTGQKRRLHLALALLSDPDILFLDEPTAGLDVEGRVALHELLRSLKNRGKTIILASHDMAEVENLCDRIAILKEGNIVFLGTVEELTASMSTRYHIEIRTSEGACSCDSDDIGDTLLSLLEDYKKRGITVLDVKIDQGTLEQHFIDLARGDNQ